MLFWVNIYFFAKGRAISAQFSLPAGQILAAPIHLSDIYHYSHLSFRDNKNQLGRTTTLQTVAVSVGIATGLCIWWRRRRQKLASDQGNKSNPTGSLTSVQADSIHTPSSLADHHSLILPPGTRPSLLQSHSNSLVSSRSSQNSLPSGTERVSNFPGCMQASVRFSAALNAREMGVSLL